eukprot:scaffold24470_cov18-Tisochrysis_lutea.AAC.2
MDALYLWGINGAGELCLWCINGMGELCLWGMDGMGAQHLKGINGAAWPEDNIMLDLLASTCQCSVRLLTVARCLGAAARSSLNCRSPVAVHLQVTIPGHNCLHICAHLIAGPDAWPRLCLGGGYAGAWFGSHNPNHKKLRAHLGA